MDILIAINNVTIDIIGGYGKLKRVISRDKSSILITNDIILNGKYILACTRFERSNVWNTNSVIPPNIKYLSDIGSGIYSGAISLQSKVAIIWIAKLWIFKDIINGSKITLNSWFCLLYTSDAADE